MPRAAPPCRPRRGPTSSSAGGGNGSGWITIRSVRRGPSVSRFYIRGADGCRMTNVLLQTTMGDVKIELFDDRMPITTANFRKLVETHFYDGTIFHRVIAGFMIQGGDPEGTGHGGPGYAIKDELPSDNRNARGTISMANAGPNTGGSQFFINVVDNARDRKSTRLNSSHVKISYAAFCLK